jgi:hypothetical protein
LWSKVLDFSRCRLFDISVSSAYKLTLKIEDVAFKVEQKLLFLTFDSDSFEAFCRKIIRVINVNYIVFLFFAIGLFSGQFVHRVFYRLLFGGLKLVIVKLSFIFHLVERVCGFESLVASELRVNYDFGLVELIKSVFPFIIFAVERISRDWLFVHLEECVQLVDHLLVGIFLRVLDG